MTTLATAGYLYVLSGSTSVDPGPSPISSDALRSLLVPPHELTDDTVFQEAVTLEQAEAAGLYVGTDQPAGMAAAPESCFSFLENVLGDEEAVDGWVRYGIRGSGPPGRQTYLTQLVARIPGGVRLDEIQDATGACQQGTITLEGQVTGTTGFTEQAAPELASATTFITRMTSLFAEPAGDEAAHLLERYNFAQLTCPAEYVFIVIDDVLIWTLDPDPAFAMEAAAAIHQRALESIGSPGTR